MNAKTEPSPRQRQIVEAVGLHGSVAAAAEVLGITALTVDRAVSSYHRRVCGARIKYLEEEVARLQAARDIDRTASRLERLVGQIERSMIPVSHRRLADGGVRVRKQLETSRVSVKSDDVARIASQCALE